MREICVILSCTYVQITAIATGVLPHNSKRNNHLLVIGWTPKAGVRGSNPLGRAISLFYFSKLQASQMSPAS